MYCLYKCTLQNEYSVLYVSSIEYMNSIDENFYWVWNECLSGFEYFDSIEFVNSFEHQHCTAVQCTALQCTALNCMCMDRQTYLEVGRIHSTVSSHVRMHTLLTLFDMTPICRCSRGSTRGPQTLPRPTSTTCSVTTTTRVRSVGSPPGRTGSSGDADHYPGPKVCHKLCVYSSKCCDSLQNVCLL